MLDGGALYPSRMQDLNAAMPAPMPALYKHELPDSQESYISVASSTFSAPQLPSSSSNLSAPTTGDTDITSPPLPKAPFSQKLGPVHAIPPSTSRSRGHDAVRNDAMNALRTGDTAANPKSLDSTMAHGQKRAADGSVKGSEPAGNSSVAPTAGHKRNKSTDVGSNGRIGQLSAQLKTRLSYAMVKVQNNWEKQSLEELEERISQHGSPMSSSNRTPGPRPVFESPTTAERSRGTSGSSENSDQIMVSPGLHTPSDPSKTFATTPSLWRPGNKPTMTAAVNLISVTGSHSVPTLGPAPEFSPRRKRRSSASHHPPPPLIGSNQRKHFSDLGAGSRTPITPRPGILRMPSQQAEKDAVDTLLFMSSPNNSGRIPHMSTDGQAPRHKFAPPQRRVMFENHLPPQKGTDQLHAPIPSGQHAGYYRAEPPR